MANVTRIKAKDPNQKKPKDTPKQPAPKAEPKKKTLASTNSPAKAKLDKKAAKLAKKEAKKANNKPMPKWLAVITAPFRAFGRYLRDSWHEIRQVRWPSRKATWKMTGAILVYAALIMVIILLLDALFTFIFNNILGS